MRLILYCVVVFTPIFLHSMSYDVAAYDAQKGNWKDAYQKLNNILINSPDQPDLLCDAGFAAYKLGNFSQAAAYCTRAAECSSDDALRFRAHCDAANAYVADKQLECALEQCDKALAVDPRNENARSNRDRVAQMLQEQKQQQEQHKDDKQQHKNDEQKDEHKDEQKNNQQQNNDQKNDDHQDGADQKNDQSADQNNEQQQNADQQDGNEQQEQQQKNGQQNADQTSDKKSQSGKRDDAEGDKKAERKNHGDKEKKQQDSAQDKKRNGDQKLDNKSDKAENERDTKQGNKHNAAPEKHDETTDASSVAAEGGQEQALIDDPWLLNVLNNQEQRDKAINKQLMEAKIRQQGGKNGQNCW